VIKRDNGIGTKLSWVHHKTLHIRKFSITISSSICFPR